MKKSKYSLPTVLDANKFLMDATDAAVFATNANDSDKEGTSSSTQATAAIQTTGLLDIQQLLPSFSAASGQVSMPLKVNFPGLEASTVQALLETCCCRINETEVSVQDCIE
ncbi:unnamed protein product [Gongylonema pulchrum]|uniref:Uncharacterized protein n=1 Tax=Gongylonema pulchrum TaxID=637853 RepID=A0A183EV22_9BILA|nr:unnamed protein product [Gongylonema pulchrum]